MRNIKVHIQPMQYSSIKESNLILKLVSLTLVLVVIFQPTYSLVTVSLSNNQEKTLVDINLQDSQEDDSQEQNEENQEGFRGLELSNNMFLILKSNSNLFCRKHWSEIKLGIITPPPEIV